MINPHLSGSSLKRGCSVLFNENKLASLWMPFPSLRAMQPKHTHTQRHTHSNTTQHTPLSLQHTRTLSLTHTHTHTHTAWGCPLTPVSPSSQYCHCEKGDSTAQLDRS